jgi:HD-GYP domain-containing protein (c-di-GMP phosphodiesterase class II)
MAKLAIRKLAEQLLPPGVSFHETIPLENGFSALAHDFLFVAKAVLGKDTDISIYEHTNGPQGLQANRIFGQQDFQLKDPSSRTHSVPIYLGDGTDSGYYQAGQVMINTAENIIDEPGNELSEKLEILGSILSFVSANEISKRTESLKPVEEQDEYQRLNNLIQGYLVTLEQHTPETVEHTRGVADLSLELLKHSTAYFRDNVDIQKLYNGALLHDIGKLMVPKSILNSPDKLTLEQDKIMKRHPYNGLNLLYLTPELLAIVDKDIIINHQETYGGSGYPRGRKEEDIPPAAQICQICDVVKALCEPKRNYRRAKARAITPESLIEFLDRNVDRDGYTQFFNPVLRNTMIDLIYDNPLCQDILFGWMEP